MYVICCCRDPNSGNSDVPVTWPEFTSAGHEYIDIHSEMDVNYVGTKMRLPFVKFWTSVLPSLPFVKYE